MSYIRCDHTFPAGGLPPAHESPHARDWLELDAWPEVEDVQRHFDRVFGPSDVAFHPRGPASVHVTVHLVAPRPPHDRWLLYTTGMCQRPMRTAPGAEDLALAELCLALPPTYSFTGLKAQGPVEGRPWYTLVRWLRDLARHPHEHGTAYAAGQTIGNGPELQRLTPESGLCGWLLRAPARVPEPMRVAPLRDGRRVHLLAVQGLYRDELSVKHLRGAEILLADLDDAGVHDLHHPGRPSAVGHRFFGLF